MSEIEQLIDDVIAAIKKWASELFCKYDLDDSQIYSNKKKYCIRCEKVITKDNDSGWEAFVTGHITQSICKDCKRKEDSVAMKEDNDARHI